MTERMFRLSVRNMLREHPDNQYYQYLHSIKRPDLDSKIYLAIPSFKDPEIICTIQAALLQAANPDRIVFGICLQDDDENTIQFLRSVSNCRVKHYLPDDTLGTCAARYDCQNMIVDEDYVLQLDSHCRFASYWDVSIIHQYRMIPGTKHIITGYPSRCESFVGDTTFDDYRYDKESMAMWRPICAFYFEKDKLALPQKGWPKKDRPSDIHDVPSKGAFISAGLVFTDRYFQRVVPYDPKMYHYGDEYPYCIRAWTSGYDIYNLNMHFIFHIYNRDAYYVQRYGSLCRFSKKSLAAYHDLEIPRRLQLCGVEDHHIDFGNYGLGNERSLIEYYNWAGIDSRNGTVLRFAKNGEYDLPEEQRDRTVVCANYEILNI